MSLKGQLVLLTSLRDLGRYSKAAPKWLKLLCWTLGERNT